MQNLTHTHRIFTPPPPKKLLRHYDVSRRRNSSRVKVCPLWNLTPRDKKFNINWYISNKPRTKKIMFVHVYELRDRNLIPVFLPSLSFETQAYLRELHEDQRFLFSRPQPQLIAVNQLSTHQRSLSFFHKYEISYCIAILFLPQI